MGPHLRAESSGVFTEDYLCRAERAKTGSVLLALLFGSSSWNKLLQQLNPSLDWRDPAGDSQATNQEPAGTEL